MITLYLLIALAFFVITNLAISYFIANSKDPLAIRLKENIMGRLIWSIVLSLSWIVLLAYFALILSLSFLAYLLLKLNSIFEYFSESSRQSHKIGRGME